MERRGRGGEGCGKARGMYSLGNRKEGTGGWRGCGEPEMRERVRGGAGEYEGKRGDVGKRGRARKKRGKM